MYPRKRWVLKRYPSASVTILDRHEVFYCEELRQMVDLDGTHTEISNPEQLFA